jgi:hypothetical protein
MNPEPVSSSPSVAFRVEPFGWVCRDAAIVVAIAVLLGVVNNLARGQQRIAFIQSRPYDILVPCTESVGQASAIAATTLVAGDAVSLIIDARSVAEYAAWHFPDALNVPFDWLGPPVQDEVGRLAKQVAATQAHRVVVYGDGEDPDSGREWARLLAGGGIRNVVYVEGGAPALRVPTNHDKGVKP